MHLWILILFLQILRSMVRLTLIEKVRLVIEGLGLMRWSQMVLQLAQIAVHDGGTGGFTPTAACVIIDLMLRHQNFLIA